MHVYVGRKAWICTIRGLHCVKRGSVLCATIHGLSAQLCIHCTCTCMYIRVYMYIYLLFVHVHVHIVCHPTYSHVQSEVKYTKMSCAVIYEVEYCCILVPPFCWRGTPASQFLHTCLCCSSLIIGTQVGADQGGWYVHVHVHVFVLGNVL